MLAAHVQLSGRFPAKPILQNLKILQLPLSGSTCR